jgi:hypothetical protein
MFAVRLLPHGEYAAQRRMRVFFSSHSERPLIGPSGTFSSEWGRREDSPVPIGYVKSVRRCFVHSALLDGMSSRRPAGGEISTRIHIENSTRQEANT